jgi:tetratricopeptide (TPR) repeat protein
MLICLMVSASIQAGAISGAKIPVTTASEGARKEFLKGRELFENLKRQEAAPYFKKACALDPSFALAAAYYAQAEGTARGFFDNLARAVELAPKVSEGEREIILGWQAGASGRIAEQRTHWGRAVELFPEDERALTLLGIHYFGQQDYRHAAEYFIRAVTVNPAFPQAYNQLGYAQRFLGDMTAAENAFRKYTELIPDDPNPHDSYAELLLKIGKFEESVARYRRALAVDPGFIASYVGIACARMYQDRPDDARAEVAAMLAHAHDDGDRRFAYFVSTLTYVEEGKTEDAIAEMKKEYAIAEKLGDAASMGADLGTMAAIRFEAGQVDEAERLYVAALAAVERSALKEDVKSLTRVANRYNVAMIAAARGEYGLARQEAAALQRESEALSNANLVRLAHELKGRIALLQKDWASAIAEFRQASDQNPYNLYRLGVASREIGKEEDAKRWFGAAGNFNGLPALNYAFIRAKARTALAAQ